MKNGQWIILSACLILSVLIASCGGSGKQCGDGTVEQDGRCVPTISDCAAGTVLQEGECVPVCGAGEFWDGSACQAVPDCATGTTFNPATGACEPDSNACGTGSHMEDGACVPDLACGLGTHAQGGECVPDTFPPADVHETGDPETTAEVTLPGTGLQVTLDGVIETPVDRNEDGIEDAEFDGFTFQATAGTYLRITATSEGAAMPAFLIGSLGEGGGEHADYIRYALEPNALGVDREFYLPYTDTYIMWVSDYANVHAYVFGYDTVPVGGDDFSYYITIENLGTPSPDPIGSLPSADSGDLSDGSLRFYRLSGLADGDMVGLSSLGLPLTDVFSDVYAVLMLIDGDGVLLAEEVAYRPDESAENLLSARSGEEYLVVLDYLLLVGPNREYVFQATDLTPQVCTSVDCTSGSLPEGETVLLAWDLVPGDFLVAGLYLPFDSMEVLEVRLIDEDMNHLWEEQYVDAYYNGVGRAYADRNMRVYMWIREVMGRPVSTYTLDDRVTATPLLESGQDYTGMGVIDMPPWTFYPAGVDHFVGQAGQVVYFSGFATHDGSGAWITPTQRLLTPDFRMVGPVVDVQAWNFPDGMITPLIGYIQTNGHYVHYVQDPNGDILDGTYDVSVNAYDPTVLGKPEVDAPVDASTTYGVQPAWNVFEAEANQFVEITVDPGGMFDQLQPELWIFNLGEPYWYWIYYIWLADPDATGLGLVKLEAGAAKGEPITVGYTSPYDGPSLVLVQDAGGTASVLDNFVITVEVPPPPSNDSCADASPITPDGTGHASVSGDARSATDTVTEHVCDGYLYDQGPEVFYWIELEADDTITVNMDSEQNASVYLFTDCADVVGSIVAESNEGNPEELTYQVPAGAGGTYVIGADFCGEGGEFILDIQVSGS